jgi:hypothetical protein
VDQTANESDYSAVQALLGATSLLALVGIAATIIVANLGGVLQ